MGIIQELKRQKKAVKTKYSMANIKAEFDEAVRDKWIKTKAQAEIDREVALGEIDRELAKEMYRLYESGVTITKLGEMYGTKDRKTIVDYIEGGRRNKALAEIPSSVATFELFPVQYRDFPEKVWRFRTRYYDNWTAGQTEPWTGEIDVYADEYGDPIPVPDTLKSIGNPLHVEITRGDANGEVLSGKQQ